MAAKSIQLNASLVILLLLGAHVIHIDGARRLYTQGKASSTSFASAADEDTDALRVPTSDEGCKRVGSTGCEPADYCVYKRKMLTWSRDASCHLETVFRPDSEIFTMYARSSGKLVRRAEKFRSQGSLNRLRKLRKNLNTLSLCDNAAASNVPPKPKTLELRDSFRTMTIEKYWEKLQDELPASDAGKTFEGASFSTESLHAQAFERTIDSLDKGMDTTKVLKAIKDKINIAKLMEMKMNPSSDPEVLTSQLQAAFPSVEEEKLKDMAEKTLGGISNLEQSCNGDENCVQRKILEAREEVLDKVAEEEEKATDSLMELAEASGLVASNATHVNAEDPHAASFLMLEQHIESNANASAELMTRWQTGAILLVVSAIAWTIIGATACIASIICGLIVCIIAVLALVFGIAGLIFDPYSDYWRG